MTRVSWPMRLLGAVSLALAASSVHAWGFQTHELIADLAQERLSPSALTELQGLLAEEPGATLASVATWADRQRTPQAAPWHYVNTPRVAPCQYEAERDCAGDQCVVAQLTRQLRILRDSPDRAQRITALKWLVHLVGDVHQPLHAGFADDRGANLYQVRAFGRGSNLHALWDTGMPTHWPTGPEGLAQEVRAAMATVRSRGFEPVQWAQASCLIATSNGLYPDGRVVDESYLERWRPVLVRQIAAAAVRLGELLNTLERQ